MRTLLTGVSSVRCFRVLPGVDWEVWSSPAALLNLALLLLTMRCSKSSLSRRHEGWAKVMQCPASSLRWAGLFALVQLRLLPWTFW